MLKVLAAGFQTSIQDMGRNGFAHFGVPRSGVMDEMAVKWANHLLQNEDAAAVIEMTMGGCKFEFLEDTCICITGADFNPTVDDKAISMYKIVVVARGSILGFGKRNYGVRTYIAVTGGFKTPMIMGSRSFFQGITNQSTIIKGDIITYEKNSNIFMPNNAAIKVDISYFTQESIYCSPGPEFHLLSNTQKEHLFSTRFTISSDNNRMGYRLNEIIENDLPTILTSAVLPGTVQLTPSGKLIILMRDCQVTGGYPRILQLVDESTNVLAQKMSGEGVVFVENN